MEQIKLIFYVLSSFFAIEDGKIGAEKTTVTVNPQQQEITIVQENLFTVLETDKDKELVLVQWDKLYSWEENETAWATVLDSFTNKTVTYTTKNNKTKPQIVFNYPNNKALYKLGIWHNAEKNLFSINEVPRQNTKTDEGILDGNYWYFKGDQTFSFTLEPFLEMPEQYRDMIKTIDELILENKK